MNSHLEITVADTGRELNPSFCPTCSTVSARPMPVRRASTAAWDLGLAIVKQLVELHGGTVRVKSAGTGQGDSFVVQLPLTIIHAPPERYPAASRKLPPTKCGAAKPIRLDGIKVLVVDDQTRCAGTDSPRIGRMRSRSHHLLVRPPRRCQLCSARNPPCCSATLACRRWTATSS